MKIIISECEGCPFLQMLDMAVGYQCKMSKPEVVGYINEDENFMAVTPDWCPLKNESFEFEFKTK